MEAHAKLAAEPLKGGIIYQVFLRAFTPEGTFAAATQRLGEIAATGSSIIYLAPFIESDDDPDPRFWSERQKKSGCDNPRNPYRVMDFYRVDPEYGTDADFKRFVAQAHALNMKVIVDLVYYHAGPTFARRHPDFIMQANGAPDLGQWCFPRLDFANPDLREHLWRNMEYFVRDFDVDGFRCDVGSGIPLDFWEIGRQRAEAVKPQLIMLNEDEWGRPEDQLRAFDLGYSFSWCFRLADVLDGKAGALALRQAWQTRRDKTLPGARFINSFENHDVANDSYDNRPEKRWGPQGVEAALAACFLIDGVPFIYNGISFGDTTRHSIYSRPKDGFHINRSGNSFERTALLRALSDMRRSRPALYEGQTQWLLPSVGDALSRVIMFTRSSAADQLTIVVNLSPEAHEVTLSSPVPAGNFLLARRAERSASGLCLGPHGFAVIEDARVRAQ